MNGWLLRALVEDLSDDGLREHATWTRQLLEERRRAAAVSDADELPRHALVVDEPFADHDTERPGE